MQTRRVADQLIKEPVYCLADKKSNNHFGIPYFAIEIGEKARRYALSSQNRYLQEY